jgi:DNA-binding transcriptional LysR family regulator
MEIKQLEYFRAIVDEGNVSAAARALHMTQPPLSYQMKMLEEELQVQLFIRGTKRITLTETGKVLYARATSLLTMTDITKREVIKASQSATLHIGLTPSSVSIMSDYLVRFASKYSDIHFDIHEGSTFALKNELENGLVDITTLRTPIVLNECNTCVLLQENLVAMAIPGFFDIEYTNISLKELSQKSLILSHRYRKYIISAFEDNGLTCDIYCECEDARTAITLAEHGLGVAILPSSMRELNPCLYAYSIKDTNLSTEILLAWRDERIPIEVEKFLSELK